MIWTENMDAVLNHWKIRHLGTEKKGDTYQMIYLKLVALAAKAGNNGYVCITPSLPFSDKGLALELGKHVLTVRKALDVLEKYGLLERITGGFLRITLPEALPQQDENGREESNAPASPAPVAPEPPEREGGKVTPALAKTTDIPSASPERAEETSASAKPPEPEKEDADMPFGLTEKEMHDSMMRLEEMENIIKDAGLPCNQFTLNEARNLVNQFGVEKFREAAQITATNANPVSWNYLKAVIKGTGKKPCVSMRQVYGSAPEPPNKYVTEDYKPMTDAEYFMLLGADPNDPEYAEFFKNSPPSQG